MSTFTSINIETLILVAVWEKPFVFQGCFKLTDKNKHKQRLLFFRCECDRVDQVELLEENFPIHHYHLTHLHDEFSHIQLQSTDDSAADALYILQYAIHTTLQKMLTNSKQHLTAIDEITLKSISRRIEPILNHASWSNEENELGFAVAMDFRPHNETSQKAVLLLLEESYPFFPDYRALH
ncbi:TPA: hypothetical protein ACPSKB_001545 [Legionella feeleii]